MSKFQRSYTLLNIFKSKERDQKRHDAEIKVLLSFIDPEKAKAFDELDSVENTEFDKELMEAGIDPSVLNDIKDIENKNIDTIEAE